MKLDKAIEILQSPESLAIISLDPDLKDATQLGLEALKRFKAYRENPAINMFVLLPGEAPREPHWPRAKAVNYE